MQAQRVVVYSDNRATRRAVIDAVGSGSDAVFVEVATHTALRGVLDGGGVDVVVLDGEATPAGGMGIARQMRDELAHCPEVVLLTARAADAWLAVWARADVVIGTPRGGVEFARAIEAALRCPRRRMC